MKKTGYFFLGWIIPGAGHLFLRKWWRGIIFFISIMLMFFLGLLMKGKFYSFQMENPLTILTFVADLGNGFLYLISRLFQFGQGDMSKITFEYGTAYLAGAGLLNYLIALDAFDIARGKKK